MMERIGKRICRAPAFIALCTLFVLAGAARAGTLTFPAPVRSIGEEAFCGDRLLDTVVLPEGVEEIGARAFADSSLTLIRLPASLTDVAGDAFSGCTDLTAEVYEGSPAHEACVRMGIPFRFIAPGAASADGDLPEDGKLCLVAMGYRLNPDGSMQEELIGRLRVMKRAAEKYPNAVIVCTGGPTAKGVFGVTEAGRMAEWLRENGVDPDRILVEDRAMTTGQNAVYTYEMLSLLRPQVTHILIITSDYHMDTSVRMFRAQAEKTGVGVTVSAGEAWPTR